MNSFSPEFEHYIADYVNGTTTEPIFNAKMKNANRVLSFNYSNTFERLYNHESKAEVCYINGKADISINKSHIVFGYDPVENQKDDLWCEYDKVFQRAYKTTDIQYKKWMKGEQSYFIHILGHSLGQTDHAILRLFIKGEKNQTTVFIIQMNHTSN